MLDDGFFLYFEEVDYCLRAARAGWQTKYIPKSQVIHLVGKSSGFTDKEQLSKPLPLYWFKSRARYFVKNFGSLGRFGADLAWLLGHLLCRLRNAILLKSTDGIRERQLFDFVKYNFWWASRV
jgi:GT2 family glycosyltransferase